VSRRLRRCAATAALLAGLRGAAAAFGVSTLEIEVAKPVFEGGELEIEVRRGGPLAGRALVVHLVIDGRAVERYPLSPETTRIAARSPALTAGIHEIQLKSGSVRAIESIRVWPRWMPGAALGVGLAVLAAAGVGWRRRSRR
jgi:hypothetical protein